MIFLIFLITAYGSENSSLQKEINAARAKMESKRSGRIINDHTLRVDRKKNVIEINKKHIYDTPKTSCSQMNTSGLCHYDVPKKSISIQGFKNVTYANIPQIPPKKFPGKNFHALHTASRNHKNVTVQTKEDTIYLDMNGSEQDFTDSWSEDSGEFANENEYETIQPSKADVQSSKPTNSSSVEILVEDQVSKDTFKINETSNTNNSILMPCLTIFLMLIYVMGMYLYINLADKDYTLSIVSLFFAISSLILFFAILFIHLILQLKN